MPLAPLDPARTALVIIDLQKGIVGMNTQPRSGAEVVANAGRLVNAFHERDGLVVFVRVAFSPDGGDRIHVEIDAPMQSAAGSPPPDFSEIVPDLPHTDRDLVITKHQWGAFYGTALDLELRRRGVDTIVLCGISTDIGVESTARAAYERNYNQIFAEDAMASRSIEGHEYPVKNIFPRMGRVRSTSEIVDALSA